MPQTLLAISAIVITGFLTLSQGSISRKTTESVVKDQFELAVAGTLLHTMEFIDSRAFDEFTTPEKLRQRMGLPESMTSAERDTITFDDLTWIRPNDFATVSSFGGADCNVENPLASPGCDDVDDISDGKWHPVNLKTPDGDPLPIEVKVDVTYVDAAAGEEIDAPVSQRTFHKRVEIYARSDDSQPWGGGSQPVEVRLRRVISFDTDVAAEYLRRSIGTTDESDACAQAESEWHVRSETLENTLEDAQGAEHSAVLRQSEASDAWSAASKVAQDAADHQAALDQTASDADRTAEDRETDAQDASNAYDTAVDDAARANEDRDEAVAAAETAAGGLVTAQEDADRTAAARDQAEADVDATVDAYYVNRPLFEKAREDYTVVFEGQRYWRNGVTAAQKNEYISRRDENNRLARLFDEQVIVRTKARNEANQAASDLEQAQEDADAADARATTATTNATDAATRLATAKTAEENAEAAATKARTDAGTARTAADAAAEVTAAANADADVAREALAAADAALAAARAAASEAQQAYSDHQNARPTCSA